MTTRKPATETKQLPLTGYRVLDLTRVVSGPYCGLLLSEMGAEVIKMEMFSKGAPIQRATTNLRGEDAFSYGWLAMNRKSFTLNLYTEEGKEIFRGLVKNSDVILENFRVGTIEKMGFGYEELCKINPGIVLTSISGFGQNTPIANYPAHNGIINAYAGLTDRNRYEDSPPLNPTDAHADCTSGTLAALGTVAALCGREKTGKGQHVDVSMLDGMIGQVADAVARFMMHLQTTGKADESVSAWVEKRPFHECFMSKNGWVYLQADNDDQFSRWAKCVGREDLLQDPKFKTGNARRSQKAFLDKIAAEWIAARTREDIFATLAGAGVPASPVNTIGDVAQSSYLKERGFLQHWDRTPTDTMPVLSPRIQFEGVAARKPSYARSQGEHTDELLKSLLKYDAKKIEDLKTKGIV